MREEFLPVFCCPECTADLVLRATRRDGEEIVEGALHCSRCSKEYQVERGVPRFAGADNYAQSFGYQWNAFRRTQLDSCCGAPISRERFLRETRWAPEELAGKLVLDIGCGAGRFTEVALSFGARVVSLDYSSAVDAAYLNLAPHPRLTIVQGSLFALPVKNASFDFVYCLGVLQHTPDPHQAVLCLAPPLKPGGRLAIDFYPALATNALWPKYWLRPLTRRMNNRTLFKLVEKLTPALLSVSNILAAVPLIGRKLKYLVPVMNYRNVLPLDAVQQREWATLDTFDMFAPAHDHPQTAATVKRWLGEAGFSSIEAMRDGLVVGRAVR